MDMRSQVNMMWNKMPYHHTNVSNFIYIFFKSSNHGFFFFFMTHHGITCREFFNYFFFPILTSFSMMYMFVYCIYMRYIDAHIHQGLSLRPRGGMHQGRNH